MKAKIYSTAWCDWCNMAKNALEARNIEYEEIRLDTDENIARFKADCPEGTTTVPQILIDRKYIGGYRELDNFFGELSLEKNSVS